MFLTTNLSASEAVRKTEMKIWASRSDYTHFMSLEHVTQIQHAGNTSDRRDNHDILNINSDARHMSEFSAMMRWACKEDAEQNEDSN